jgi:hypothetical protein
MTRIASLTLAAWLAGCSAEVAQPPEDAGDSGSSTSAEGGDSGASAEAGCPGTLLSCPAGCVDPQTDPKNCGGCGQLCNALQSCVGGSCVEPCNGAGQATCAGTCVDEETDPGNCGSCGHACNDGEVCSGGACGPDPCAAFLDCEECIPNSACG